MLNRDITLDDQPGIPIDSTPNRILLTIVIIAVPFMLILFVVIGYLIL